MEKLKKIVYDPKIMTIVLIITLALEMLVELLRTNITMYIIRSIIMSYIMLIGYLIWLSVLLLKKNDKKTRIMLVIMFVVYFFFILTTQIIYSFFCNNFPMALNGVLQIMLNGYILSLIINTKKNNDNLIINTNFIIILVALFLVDLKCRLSIPFHINFITFIRYGLYLIYFSFYPYYYNVLTDNQEKKKLVKIKKNFIYKKVNLVMLFMIGPLVFSIFFPRHNTNNKWGNLSDEDKQWYTNNYGNGKSDKINKAIDNYKKTH